LLLTLPMLMLFLPAVFLESRREKIRDNIGYVVFVFLKLRSGQGLWRDTIIDYGVHRVPLHSHTLNKFNCMLPRSSSISQLDTPCAVHGPFGRTRTGLKSVPGKIADVHLCVRVYYVKTYSPVVFLISYQ
jgi:hypothetical protein